MSIGNRIKTRRMELGMTQQDLADKVGYKTKAAINKIELDERSLKQSMIKPMCEALNVSLAWLMEEDTEELFANLPAKQKELVHKFIELTSLLTDEEMGEVIKHLEFTIYKRNN